MRAKCFLFCLNIAGATLFFTQLVGATALDSDVCQWSNKSGYALATNGYEWGGGKFSTLKECGLVLRANLLAINLFKNRNGKMLFLDPSGRLEECTMRELQSPPSAASPEFQDLMQRSYTGRASAQELLAHETYLDQNLQLTCAGE